MITYRITEINYETDGEVVELPTELDVVLDKLPLDEDSLTEELANLITAQTGWLVNDFMYEAVN
jgi:hypothetical protein